MGSVTSIFGLCTSGGGLISDLTEICQYALQKCVCRLLAFKDDLQAEGQQESLIPLYLCKFFSMIDGN